MSRWNKGLPRVPQGTSRGRAMAKRVCDGMSREGLRRSKFEHRLARLIADKTGRESADMKRDRLEATASRILRRNKDSAAQQEERECAVDTRNRGSRESEQRKVQVEDVGGGWRPVGNQNAGQKAGREPGGAFARGRVAMRKGGQNEEAARTKDEVSMSKMFVPDDEIWAKRTEKAKQAGIGAWSAKQLAAWGEPWPPPKGWRRKLNGGVYRALDDESVVTRARARLDVAVKAAEPEFQDIVTEVLSELEDAPPWN
jgi:hypothetical protein